MHALLAETTDSLALDLPWGAVGVVLLGALVVLTGSLLAELRRVHQRLERLDRLEDLRAQLGKLTESSSGLDLRRIEHVLIDLRDLHKHLEERLLAAVEAGGRIDRAAAGGALDGPALAERAVSRLLAMGYERVRVLTPPSELAKIAAEGGDVVVEARRDGAIAKGRVLVREGAITDVEMRSVHTMFP